MPPESARGTTSRHNTDLVSRGPVVLTADKVGIVLYRLCYLSFLPHLEGLLLLPKNKKNRLRPNFPIRNFASNREIRYFYL